MFTDKGAIKRIKLEEFSKTSRAKRGVQLIREIKSNPHHVIKIYLKDVKTNVYIKTNKEISKIKLSALPISDRYSSGSSFSKEKVLEIYDEVVINEKQIEELPAKKLDLKDIDEKILTIDDFLKDMN